VKATKVTKGFSAVASITSILCSGCLIKRIWTDSSIKDDE